MKKYARSCYRFLFTLLSVVLLVLSQPGFAVSSTAGLTEASAEQKTKLLNGEVIVALSSLGDGVTGVTGHIYIAAPPQEVWQAITDYDNHKNFVPNVLDSGVLSDNGTEKIMFEKGKSGMFLFQKKVFAKLKVWGERLKHLQFEQLEGDFKVYRGEWILDENHQGKGTFLTYRAQVKPDFFAPQFAIRNVQERDCPLMMLAMKKQAEALAQQLREKALPLTGSQKTRTGTNQS